MVYTRVAGVVEAAGELAADCRLRPVEVHAAIATLRVTDNAVRKALRAIASPVVWGSDWRARSHPPRRGRLHGSGGSAHGRAVGSGSSADRPGRGRGPGPWARPGRRRLPDQAVRLP